ncbi:helix-turn-helix domain-containing protein [Nocardioides sp. TF02-7]|uniref:PucR family transcriptional regulator n=1 Tax=Nocardioides sp. TF02-7 TaxID=2917724 RepID=UPI001F054FCC|nr:helix-turn-helix domain-containing protein [Nocardioides sp. TF02-7]UMG93963.1 helix-turn-helix domain-containing protein [Nocardioides sp. TF02-7]
MITAAGLADALAPAVVELAQPGEDRPVLGVEIVEAGGPATVDRGDVVVGVGARDVTEVLEVVAAAAPAAGLVLRRTWADDERVRSRCAAAGLPLLTVADDAAWSSALTVLRSALEAATTGPGRAGDRVYGDLFDMADRIGALLGAPVTIEDATSRVLAYSTGQVDVDQARMSTIVGRRVPREVRDHFRSLGVFRRLATSDEPFFVPAGAEDVRARYVVPVRAGGEWLGSVWAVVDEPVAADRARELGAATEVVALLLLRLRSQSELHRQVQRDQVRSVLQGAATERPDWLEDGPWRVAAVAGPANLGVDARCELWLGLARKHGWRQPAVADLDGVLYAVVADDGTGPGCLDWLADVVAAERRRDPAVGMYVGRRAATVGELQRSRAEAAELGGLGAPDRPVLSVDEAWGALVLSRAVDGLAHRPLVSPVAELAGAKDGALLLATLEAVVDYWGEPQRAAHVLGVHPNTVRHRTARITARCAVDLDDPVQRLAVRLELARLRRGGELGTP